MSTDQTSTDKRVSLNRASMVLFSLEQSLGGYVRENIAEVSDLPDKQTKKFTLGPNKVGNVEELVQETYISEILDMAIAAANQLSDRTHLQRIKSLADCLELYEIRNAVAHPNRPFPDCYWYRLAALANDPAIAILGFSDVKHAFDSAMEDRISLPPEEWFGIYAFRLPNNLPDTTDHDLTGLIGRERETTDLLKKLKKRRFPLVSLVGPGGTGKTAIALDILRDASLEPATLDWAEQIVYVTAKTEQLTKDGPIQIDNPIVSMNDVRESLTNELNRSNGLGDLPFKEACNALAGHSVLLCIDNLETLLRDHPDAFDEFYEDLPEKWRVLVTSRVPVESATNVPINPMNTPAARRLTSHYASRRGDTSLDANAIERLVEKTECNPLAIRITVDGIVAGLDVAEALKQSKDGILEFSYTNLLRSLPEISNKILECMFAANSSLARSDIRFLLETDSDTVATGIQALIRTSLISRHAGDSVETYSLSGSVRDLLLRNPLDDLSRAEVFERLASQEQELAKLKSQDKADPLDNNYMPSDSLPALVQPLIAAFQMPSRKTSKAAMADHVADLRTQLREHSVPALYRATAILFRELNDRTSARQVLEQANHLDALDPAGLLMLAEHYKDDGLLEESSELGARLHSEGWFDSTKTDRTNLARIARVSWLVDVWRGHQTEVATATRDWNAESSSRAIKGSMYVTALRRLFENQPSMTRASGYVTEIVSCLDTIFREDGYVGFVVGEAAKTMFKISDEFRNSGMEEPAVAKLVDFVDTHFVAICNVHSQLSLTDATVLRFLEWLRQTAISTNAQQPKPLTAKPEHDPALSQYGYVNVEVYHRPKDSYGNYRGFFFAKDEEGQEYHVSSRAMINTKLFNELVEGDYLMVLPREDFDEGKARPVRDAIPAA